MQRSKGAEWIWTRSSRIGSRHRAPTSPSRPVRRFWRGGTWLFSEPQPDLTGLVDLTTMGWPDLEITRDGLRIAATCTIAQLVAFAEGAAAVRAPADWAAASVFPVAANALLASFKIWNTATVGGNVCRSFCRRRRWSRSPSALDGDAVVWTPDGGERRQPVASLITGNGTNSPRRRARCCAPSSCPRTRFARAHAAAQDRARRARPVRRRRDRPASTTTARAVFTVTAATLTPVRAALRRTAVGADGARGRASARRPATTPIRTAPPTGARP